MAKQSGATAFVIRCRSGGRSFPSCGHARLRSPLRGRGDRGIFVSVSGQQRSMTSAIPENESRDREMLRQHFVRGVEGAGYAPFLRNASRARRKQGNRRVDTFQNQGAAAWSSRGTSLDAARSG